MLVMASRIDGGFRIKMKRQGLKITIGELERLIKELKEETDWFGFEIDKGRVFQINIINKEGLSDTWEIE